MQMSQRERKDLGVSPLSLLQVSSDQNANSYKQGGRSTPPLPSPRTFLWLELRDCARGTSQLEQRQREAHIQCAAGEREHSWPSLEGDTDSGMQLLGTGSMLTTPTWIPVVHSHFHADEDRPCFSLG